ncbi:methyltransferase domain protein [Leptospira interrogans str. L1207]|nr:methyltransferase domain protein [Leptospira interrogans str. L1207]
MLCLKSDGVDELESGLYSFKRSSRSGDPIPLAKNVKEVYAIDFSIPMIEQLKNGIKETKVQNVFTYVMDGQKLEFENDRFDAAFSMFGLMFFSDKVRGLKEIHRVLKPKGKIAVSSWAPISNSTLIQCLFGALRKANPDIPAPQKI